MNDARTARARFGNASVKRDSPGENIAHPFVECCTVIHYTKVGKAWFHVAAVGYDRTHYTKTRFGMRPASTCSVLSLQTGRALLQG